MATSQRYTTRPQYTFAAVGVVPDASGYYQLRIAASRTFERDAVTLTVSRKQDDGSWTRKHGIALRANEIPHLIALLTRAREALPELPLPPEAVSAPKRGPS
ncbi:MAG: hypothetical protein ACREOQ_06275 [Gemmatimonadales bacterium]